ncbi:hypothetical protein AIZ09_23315, partial [Salmonella enterica subsp. enterica serovar Typhimurium]
YDINGLLEVAVLLEDGKSESRITSHNATSLTTQQIDASRARLASICCVVSEVALWLVILDSLLPSSSSTATSSRPLIS